MGEFNIYDRDLKLHYDFYKFEEINWLIHSLSRRKVWQPKEALHISASSAKKILIMGGTRFIGVFLSRLLVNEGEQVTLFTRGKPPITQQLPGESEKDYTDFSSKETGRTLNS
ncbi:chloroplast stem-loop binding protein of 41 kDa b, chloroplastic-like isoform X3 [Camellia sinensis]|uniref:chloroplast stem-loop binding protein of 41 kDa b, chloroplastic-like isoform X3 n=1 Tax=Camellia sinensis TaxID=4442 RepID=UPI001036530E|nr:chloroplast stem-loop binding protein of 41 kDa b, chloroplastic-like isoform X3 [Camellia sinensis]